MTICGCILYTCIYIAVSDHSRVPDGVYYNLIIIHLSYTHYERRLFFRRRMWIPQPLRKFSNGSKVDKTHVQSSTKKGSDKKFKVNLNLYLLSYSHHIITILLPAIFMAYAYIDGCITCIIKYNQVNTYTYLYIIIYTINRYVQK